MQNNSESKQIPPEILYGIPIVSITGNKEIIIENYQGIIEYTNYVVRVRTRIGELKITGQNLNIIYFTSDDMLITGEIRVIEYL